MVRKFSYWNDRRRNSRKARRSVAPRRRRSSPFRNANLSVERLEDRHMLSAGSLDPTLNPTGPLPGTQIGSLLFGGGEAIAVQPDGKILVAGTHQPAGANSQNFAVARYLPDGTLDTTFGTTDGDGINGLATANIQNNQDIGFDMQVDSLGRIVVVGSALNSAGTARGIGVARFDANGNLDTSFDGDGKAFHVIPGLLIEPRGVALQSDGKIVVAGISSTGASSSNNFVVARLNANGSLDTAGFGGGAGFVITDFGGNTDSAFDVALQSDGRIVVAGQARIGTLQQFGLARYNTDGTLDTSFDGDGKVTSQIGLSTAPANIRGLVVQSDGKIVVAGNNGSGDFIDVVVARYNPNGSLDASFNPTGAGVNSAATQAGMLRVNILPSPTTGATRDFGEGLVVQPDGNYVVVGSSSNINGSTQDGRLLVMRVLASSGTLDTGFGSGGFTLTNLKAPPGSTIEGLLEAAIQPDGKIVASGVFDDNIINDADVLARYESGLVLAPTISGDPDTDEGAVYTLNLSSGDPTTSQWTINWGDSVEIVSGNPSSATHVYADGDASYTISATVTTSTGTFSAGNSVDVTVHNVAPSLAINGAASVDEGAIYTLDLSATDPGMDTIASWTINWGDNIEVVTGNPTSVTHTYADGDANYTISATATDEDGTYAAAGVVAVMVLNVAPALALSGASDVDEGSVYTLNLSATDPGTDTIASWTINWGDSVEVVTGNPASVTHTYADGDANYTISATATDEDGTFAAGNTVDVTVNNVAPTADDPTFNLAENSANGTVVGTVTADDPGDDALTFTIVGGTGAAAFSIDSNTGVITVANSSLLDFETTPLLTLEVEVADGDGGFDTASVIIQLTNKASISGVVFVDVNQNGLYDANEPGIDGVEIQLLDEFGDPVLDSFGDAITAITDNGGLYLFEDLDTGTYQLFEVQPTGVNDGAEELGSIGGTIVANDRMQLTLAQTDAFDYAFAELGQQVASGDTATIGFWQNKHGQALITQGGSALANWLTSNFSNVFGDSLAGASGADVAKFYRDQLFKQTGKKSAGPAKVDAQFMAVALATYFTSSYLTGQVAVGYGFNVTHTGIGTKIVNVGTNGAAFGVANGTDRTILQLLLATNDLTDQPDLQSGFAEIYDTNGDGVISSSEASLRTMANEIYSSINETGDI